MGSLAGVATVPRQSGPPDEAWLQRDGLPPQCWNLTGTTVLGRSLAADVVLDDPFVSRVHARLERVCAVWTLVDDGLSNNGTWLNGRRLTSRARLTDRDHLRVGRTVLTFCAPSRQQEEHTLVGAPLLGTVRLTPAQQAVLTALARPCQNRAVWTLPATNAQIAAELFLSLDAVKTHLRILFGKFGIDGLPQNAKRLRLVELALDVGLIDDGQT